MLIAAAAIPGPWLAGVAVTSDLSVPPASLGAFRRVLAVPVWFGVSMMQFECFAEVG